MKRIKLIDPPHRMEFRYFGSRGDMIVQTNRFDRWDYNGWWYDSDIEQLDRNGVRYEVLMNDRRKKERRRG